MINKEKCCGTCLFNEWDNLWKEYWCSNDDSRYYCYPTDYYGGCGEWSDAG